MMSNTIEPFSPPVPRLPFPPPVPQVPFPPPAPSPQEEPTALALLLAELRVRKGGRGTLSMLGANFESAVDALWMNRTRSFLTALGIFIGIAAVIAALTLTQGVSAQINNQIGSLGNTVIVSPGSSSTSGGVSQGSGSSSTLTQKDAQSISVVPHLTGVSPLIVTNDQVVYQNQNWTTQIEGATTNLQAIQDWQVAQGSWFSTDDQTNGTPVAVLGDTVWHNLFDTSGNNAIGQSIRIRNQV